MAAPSFLWQEADEHSQQFPMAYLINLHGLRVWRRNPAGSGDRREDNQIKPSRPSPIPKELTLPFGTHTNWNSPVHDVVKPFTAPPSLPRAGTLSSCETSRHLETAPIWLVLRCKLSILLCIYEKTIIPQKLARYLNSVSWTLKSKTHKL